MQRIRRKIMMKRRKMVKAYLNNMALKYFLQRGETVLKHLFFLT